MHSTLTAQKLLDREYELGTLDCLSFLWKFYGDKMPRKFNGWNAYNYVQRWEEGDGRYVFYDYLHSLGEEIELHYMTDNDLLILETPEGITPAIYLGSGNMMVVTIEQGAFVMPFHALQCGIREVRRIG